MNYDEYMKFPKESLARELERRDNASGLFIPIQRSSFPDLPCYHEHGICTNPHHDCINCPRMYPGSGKVVTNTMKEVQ